MEGYGKHLGLTKSKTSMANSEKDSDGCAGQLTSAQGLGTLARSRASATPSANVNVLAIALQPTERF